VVPVHRRDHNSSVRTCRAMLLAIGGHGVGRFARTSLDSNTLRNVNVGSR
jgi:hypothetical protein